MPHFIRLTVSPSDERILVNVDQIRSVQKVGTLTCVIFAGDHTVAFYCTETQDQIMAMISEGGE